jgi:DNA repair protein SbcD/Mre11
VAGNHDIPLSTGRASSVDIFRALEVERVTVARSLSTHSLDTQSGPLQIIAFPWAVRSAVLAQPEYKNATISELNQAMIDLTRDKLRAEAAALDPDLPTVIVGHAHLFGARIGAERLLTMGADPMYEPSVFDLPTIDYVALGHIHKHQVLHYASPPMVYAGSIERVDFGEEHEDKGWVLVDIAAKGKAEWTFHKLDARPFLTIDAKVESDNATQDVVRAIARRADELTNAIVKLRIDVPPERAAELHDSDILAQLKGAYFITPFERTTHQQPRSRWGDGAAAIQRAAPLEALSMYLEYQKVDVDRRELLLRHARGLMTSEAP